jgi:hypothetical protein
MKPDFEWIGQVSEMFAKGECTREEAIQVLGNYLEADNDSIGESLDLCKQWWLDLKDDDILPPDLPDPPDVDVEEEG